MESAKVCIIGAGASGMTTVKTLKGYNIPFDCFEMGSQLGGNWRYNNDNGRSAAYDSLTIDTSKDRMQYSDFPMPKEYPVFPNHKQIIQYFDAYADHFGIRDLITYRTQVTNVTPAKGGGYDVIIRNLDSGAEETRHYTAVLVANGHHWHPKLPNFPGQFSGETTHSRNYRNPNGLEDMNVLVVGIGNSGVDIACETSKVAKQVYLSTRTGAHILPRYVMGRPIDKWVTPFSSRLPESLQARMLQTMIKLDRGDQTKFGIPKPKFDIKSAHGTVSAELPELVQNGRIQIKPNVKALCGHEIAFTDGSVEKIDAIVYATGYKITFPFFDEEFIQVEDNIIPLYRKVIDPEKPDLYFIGLIQPLGPIMPLSELQAKWVAQLLVGLAQLPDKATMQAAVAHDQAALQKRYVNSTRHTIQVDLFPYIRELEMEIENGRKRAGKKST